MTALVPPIAAAPPGAEPVAPSESNLRSQVWRVLAGIYPLEQERRHRARFPYPRLVRLIPLNADGSRSEFPPVTVVGKHLSEDGLGFYHAAPLPYRQMVAQLELPGGDMASFLVVLQWCRFIRDGWYETGARLVRPAAV